MAVATNIPAIGRRVVDADGRAAVVVRLDDEAAHAELRLDDGTVFRAPTAMMRPEGEHHRLEVSLWALAADGEVVVTAAEEALVVHRRVVERGGVRLRRVVEVHEQHVDEAVACASPAVERVVVGRFVDEAPRVREEGDRLIIPVVEEVLVVEKRLRLVEEIHVVRHVRTERVTETHPLRRSRVEVTFLPDAPASPDPDPDLRPRLRPSAEAPSTQARPRSRDEDPED
ncbi:MAG: DUF2382 domain-containing protein [Myxococcales bacterium]|nr:DUF2382 domain-containing protein [Myxococcales bacterium]